MKILICGHKSFAAKGIVNLLQANGHDVDCFSRGEESKRGNEISGDVFNMASNRFLSAQYDLVINYIIIKDSSVEENLRFINSLHAYCNTFTKQLIQISSISVYPNVEAVDENSPIETDIQRKGGYAAIKIAVDQFLSEQKKNYNVSFVRPGFITEQGKSFSKAGICVDLPLGFSVLLGNKKTSLPLIEKNRVNKVIVKIAESEDKLPCYLLLENRKGTKYQYAKSLSSNKLISLPKWFILPLVQILVQLKVLSKTKGFQVKGLFKSTIFNSYETERSLKISMTDKSIGIVGSGVYGSYFANTVVAKFPDSKITMFEIGNGKIKDEEEIGLQAKVIKGNYTGLSRGRFFGWGGTSNRWGGQLLLFSENDFKNPDGFLKEIIQLSERYSDKIFKRFNVKDSFKEKLINHNTGQFIKTGVWLSYFHRNLFKYFKISKSKNISLEGNSRVLSILHDRNKIIGILMVDEAGIKKEFYFDKVVLCAGAFESNRILMNSDLAGSEVIRFSDHLSQKVFKIKGSTLIGTTNFAFKLDKNSLITKRLVGEIDNVSYFANPIYNSEFPFFGNLKKILFKRQIDLNIVKNTIVDIPYVFLFLYNMFIKKRIYVYKNEWYLYIDIENPVGESLLEPSQQTDKFGVSLLDVSFDVQKEKVEEIYQLAIEQVENFLKANNVKYSRVNEIFSVAKIEDTYHPYAMALSDCNTLEEYFNRYENLLVLNTGVLSRAGGINTSAALFPVIEHYVDRVLFN